MNSKNIISIIIPVLNEEKTIENTIKNLMNIRGNKEIIIVDGGSNDKTVQIAKCLTKVVCSPKGRANQMNAGARIAEGNILWFVHSDSIVDENSLINIRKAIEEGYKAGGFKLYFYDDKSSFMKYISFTSNLRAKYLNIYFGDQGIFVEKNLFNNLDGFKRIYLMEDWELSKRISKEEKMKLLDCSIGTSARRFNNGGKLKTHLLMHKIKILYLLGICDKKLSMIYKEAR